MAETRHFVRALRELDNELENERMPASSTSRIARALSDHGEPRSTFAARWLPAATFAAGAAVAIIAVAYGAGRSAEEADSLSKAPPQPMLGAFVIEGDGCQATASDFATRLQGECRLLSERITIQTWDHASLAADDRYVRVLEGHVVFDVRKATANQPSVKIAVSHGIIEVVGTRFAIDQSESQGHVDLFEGKVMFYGYGGDVTAVNPGQRHSWGDGVATPVVVVVDDDEISPPVATKKKAKPAGPSDATAVIERVNELRAQGRYKKAVEVLRRALRRRWDPRTAQVLSYELGELYHRHIGDRRSACAHLRRHRAKYPGGRYKDAVDATLTKLECGP